MKNINRIGDARAADCEQISFLRLMRWSQLLALFIVALMGCNAQQNTGEAQVSQDEQAIRGWFDDWIKATTEGGFELAGTLFADDVIFLAPGVDQMDKESFPAAATASDPNIDFKLESLIQEIQIIGDHAWLASTSSFAMTDKQAQSIS